VSSRRSKHCDRACAYLAVGILRALSNAGGSTRLGSDPLDRSLSSPRLLYLLPMIRISPPALYTHSVRPHVIGLSFTALESVSSSHTCTYMGHAVCRQVNRKLSLALLKRNAADEHDRHGPLLEVTVHPVTACVFLPSQFIPASERKSGLRPLVPCRHVATSGQPVSDVQTNYFPTHTSSIRTRPRWRLSLTLQRSRRRCIRVTWRLVMPTQRPTQRTMRTPNDL
jgi:hypothetical protein